MHISHWGQQSYGLMLCFSFGVAGFSFAFRCMHWGPMSKFSSRLQVDMVSVGQRSTAPSRSRASSASSQLQAPPKRRGHAAQPSFSEYVGASAAAEPSQGPSTSAADGHMPKMPSFERLSPTDSSAQQMRPMMVGQLGSVQSEPGTPTLAASGSPMPSSTIIHDDVTSGGTPGSAQSSAAGAPAGRTHSRQAGPTSESMRRDAPRARDAPQRTSDLAVRSPFEQESSVPGAEPHSPSGDAENSALAMFPQTSNADPGAMGLSLPSGRPQYFMPPEPHEMNGEISTAGGGGSYMSYMHGHGRPRGARPPQLIIDNPNDAASTIAGSEMNFGGAVRFDMSTVGRLPTRAHTAVAAVANDRNVIDAEDQWHADRTSAMQVSSRLSLIHISEPTRPY